MQRLLESTIKEWDLLIMKKSRNKCKQVQLNKKKN